MFRVGEVLDLYTDRVARINYRLKLRFASFAGLNALAQPAFNPRLHDLYANSGYCFVHIPKNGGTTVERLLYAAKVGHRAWHELYRMAPLDYPCWTKFCVIREPFDRFLSSYDYLRSGGRNPIDREVGRRFLRKFDINTFVSKLSEPFFRNQIMRYFHFRPQAEFILSDNGYCMIDRMLRFSRMSEELAAMLDIDAARVDHLNKTDGQRTSADKLTTDSRKIIAELYARDFELYTALDARNGEDFYLRRFAADAALYPVCETEAC